MTFLPVTAEEMRQRGWDRPDFVYVCGDAYVDHPSFEITTKRSTMEITHWKIWVICVLSGIRLLDINIRLMVPFHGKEFPLA